MATAGNSGAIGFTAVYASIFVYVTWQVCVLVAQRHRKTSFKMGFNLLTMVWCVLPTIDAMACQTFIILSRNGAAGRATNG